MRLDVKREKEDFGSSTIFSRHVMIDRSPQEEALIDRLGLADRIILDTGQNEYKVHNLLSGIHWHTKSGNEALLFDRRVEEAYQALEKLVNDKKAQSFDKD